jgi:hypothetical protein
MSGIRRRMTLPSTPGREDPIYKQATKPTSDPAHGAAFIFLHGLGDDAGGLEGKPCEACLKHRGLTDA